MFGKPAIGLIPTVGSLAGVAFEALLGFIASRVLQGAIVVLDDIERKGESLSLGAILGTVSRLAEIRKAKVIVIMNEEELINADSTALSHQREKILTKNLSSGRASTKRSQLFD